MAAPASPRPVSRSGGDHGLGVDAEAADGVPSALGGGPRVTDVTGAAAAGTGGDWGDDGGRDVRLRQRHGQPSLCGIPITRAGITRVTYLLVVTLMFALTVRRGGPDVAAGTALEKPAPAGLSDSAGSADGADGMTGAAAAAAAAAVLAGGDSVDAVGAAAATKALGSGPGETSAAGDDGGGEGVDVATILDSALWAMLSSLAGVMVILGCLRLALLWRLRRLEARQPHLPLSRHSALGRMVQLNAAGMMLPSGLTSAQRARLRLAMTDRDFDGEDYDALLALDQSPPAVSQGASQPQVNRLPSHTYKASPASDAAAADGEDDDESNRRNGHWCSVCLEQFQDGETIRTIPCFHQFHAACIDPWLLDQGTCPVCKASAKR